MHEKSTLRKDVHSIEGKTLTEDEAKKYNVFSLIGPKKYDVPWKELESKSWIAEAKCVEIRVGMDEELRLKYSISDDREKFRLASENPEKIRAIDMILNKHKNSNILVIGQYINQLEMISEHFKIPLITGKTQLSERQELYSAFRTGKIKSLVVSKVANFSIDLPDANIAIQVSGTFGSRQEEAQRLGRILRPKKDDNTAIFYSLISRDTSEERFGQNRQLFLTEQGYEYEIYTYDQFKELFTVPEAVGVV
jgi:DNA excision repair protein ERCC-3